MTQTVSLRFFQIAMWCAALFLLGIAGIYFWFLGVDSFAPWLVVILSGAIAISAFPRLQQYGGNAGFLLAVLLLVWVSLSPLRQQIDSFILVGCWALVIGGIVLRIGMGSLHRR